MSRTSENGLTAGNSQPVKTLSKFTTDFIASIRRFTSGFYLDRGIDLTFVLCCVALLIQAALMALGVLV